MKSLKLVPPLLLIVAILMTSNATAQEETRKVDGITIKPETLGPFAPPN